MQYVFIILGILLVVYLALVFYGSQKVSAIGTVTAGAGRVDCKLEYDTSKKKSLYAMALCYAVKVKWLLQTEPDDAENTFVNVFKRTVKEWPEVPYVEMLSSIRNGESVFKVKVYSGKRWYVNNMFPAQYYGGDLATHYFILLKEIAGQLSVAEKEVLGNLLKKSENQIVTLQDRSMDALHEANKVVDSFLSQVDL